LITGRAPGNQRQEFWELEILDTISKLQYHGNLPNEIDEHCRSTLITQFRAWKGANQVPSYVHPAVRWSASDLSINETNDVKWHMPQAYTAM
jgi:hypothetical protein